MSSILIRKATGEDELFAPAKLVLSLRKAGASEEQANRLAKHVEGELVDGMTTSQIYHHAFKLLHGEAKPVAARYSMKRAISELGPEGFPFEKLIAAILRKKGFEAVTDQIVEGGCVEHEMDVVAWNDKKFIMVEAKFHNEPGLKSDIKVALYVKARFDDLCKQSFEYGGKKRRFDEGWLVTNTKFTEHAVRYAQCQALTLIGWNYPEKGNLEDMIRETGVEPVTSLTTLSANEKRALLQAGFVLCTDVVERGQGLSTLGFDQTRIDALVDEARGIAA